MSTEPGSTERTHHQSRLDWAIGHGVGYPITTRGQPGVIGAVGARAGLGTAAWLCDTVRMGYLPNLAVSLPALPQGLTQFGGGVYPGEFFIGLAILAVMGLSGLASFLGIVYIWIRAIKQPSPHHGLAQCGRCGYGVRGAATFQCSECGGDFRQFGIRSPAMHNAFIGPVLFIGIWSLCLWLPGFMVSGFVVAAGPQSAILFESLELQPPDAAVAGYDSISLSRSPHGLYDNTELSEVVAMPSKYVDVDLYGPNSNEWYEVDVAGGIYEDFNGSVSSPQPFDRAAFEQWVANAGGDVSHLDVQLQIDQIISNIQATQAAGLANADWSAFSVISRNSYSEYRPALWFIAIQPLFWMAVYTAGILIYLFLKHRYDKAMVHLREQAMVPGNAAAASVS